MKITDFARMKALQAAYVSGGSQIVDALLPTNPQLAEQLRRIQFDTSHELAAQLEEVVGLLGCSKREFMEMATVDAINDAKREFEMSFREAHGAGYFEREDV